MLCALAPCALPCGLDGEPDDAALETPPAQVAAPHPASLLPGGPPPPLLARPRSHHQLYTDGGARLLAGCIPFRGGGRGAAAGVEVLLITSRRGKGWGLPKGGWEDDESAEAAAQRETVEEAGVRGVLEVRAAGRGAGAGGTARAAQRPARAGAAAAPPPTLPLPPPRPPPAAPRRRVPL
jgi:8-oxo-dGTP pyrophosphatase MutT (NUDIX family)